MHSRAKEEEEQARNSSGRTLQRARKAAYAWRFQRGETARFQDSKEFQQVGEAALQ